MIKQNTKILILFVSALFLSGTEYVSASTVIGGDSTGNAFPFGRPAEYWEPYQQIYSSSAFADSVNINALSFFSIPGQTNDPSRGTFTFELSTTNASVNTLSTNYMDNIGHDNAIVYSGELPSGVIGGERFTVIFQSPFTYNPLQGNLILTITAEDNLVVPVGNFAAVSGWDHGRTSRLFNETTDNDYGLLTEFHFPVPIPGAAWLLGSGLVSLISYTQIRKRR